MPAGFSDEETVHEILVAPRGALVPLADTRVIERPGWWQIVTPSLTRGGMNEVGCAGLPDDATVEEAIETYRRLGLRFRWMVGPGADAGELAVRLACRGLTRFESLGMARAVAARGPAAGDAAAITVDAVGHANVDEFTRVMAEGWAMDAAPLDALHRRMLADPARRNHLFLARHDGIAAGVASYVALDRSAYLIGAVVLPAFRGRGLYRALVNARLRHAQARGLALATSVARAETSAPILASLGFETVCSIAVFTNV